MCYETLPDDYAYFDKIDLQNNKKQFWLIQIIALVICVAMFVGGYFIGGFDFIYDDVITEIIALAVLIVAYVLYMILHEATHGIVMRLSVKAKLNFGFNGWAAYAGSTGCFDKKHYILIALAPMVLWGVVFAVLNIFFHSGVWFWVIWLLQMGNLSGASGDLFCTYKMLGYPKDILVVDTGMNMTVYQKMTEEEKQAAKDAEESDEVISSD